MRRRSDLASTDETTLVGLARAGSHDAFEALVVLRQSWLRNFLRRLSNDSVLADDLSQEVFLSAWKGIRKLRSDEAFLAWLKRLAVNTWLKHIRGNEPLVSPGRVADTDVDLPARVATESVGEAVDLDRALAALAGEARLCVVLFYSEGMSHGTISELTRIPLGTVKSHISRGTKLLRKILAIYGEEG